MSEAVIIGDRLDNDIRPARVLGWKIVRIFKGYACFQHPRDSFDEPDATIAELTDLFSLFIGPDRDIVPAAPGSQSTTRNGHEQARQFGLLLGRALAGHRDVAMHVSPLGRACETAETIRKYVPVAAPILDPRIREVTIGSWDGLVQTDIDAGWPGMLDGASPFDWHFCAPNGEGYDEAVNRVAAWLSEVQGIVLAISHGLTGRLIRGTYLGLPRREALSLPVPQDCRLAARRPSNRGPDSEARRWVTREGAAHGIREVRTSVELSWPCWSLPPQGSTSVRASANGYGPKSRHRQMNAKVLTFPSPKKTAQADPSAAPQVKHPKRLLEGQEMAI